MTKKVIQLSMILLLGTMLTACSSLGVGVKTERLESTTDSTGTYSHNRTTIDYHPLCHGSCKGTK